MKTLRDLLSVREFKTASLIHEGFSNLEIAALMKITETTVKHHLYSINQKTGCENRTMLALRFERENPTTYETGICCILPQREKE